MASNDLTPLYDDDEAPSYKDLALKVVHDLPKNTVGYFKSLFPIFTWIGRYNLTWLYGDLVAGITIGTVVVPQGMGYAKIANLPPQIGLYSSFVGVFLYCFFATSKDITIGPVAVMSLFIGQTITSLSGSGYAATTIASTICILAGLIVFFLGIIRFAFIVDFIPSPAIAGFTTGSAITIAIGQFPNLFGITGFDTRAAAYLVLGNFLKGLPGTKWDAAFGLFGLLILYSTREASKFLTRRFPSFERPIFFVNISRNGLLVIFSTLIAFLLIRNEAKPVIAVLGTVPAGFQNIGVPVLNPGILSAVSGSLPTATILLVLEHIAIAKSFGRINGYIINPNQEFVAIGFTNIIASFFGAYPATGSFSRTAIKAKSGVRTPIAGVFSGIVVILALYALTPAFYYIPNATLAAVIIHAVGDLIAGPKQIKQYWSINPLEFFIFAISVIVTFFTTVEIGIYLAVALAMALLLFKLARPSYEVLARLRLQSQHTETARYIYVPNTNPYIHDSTVADPIPDDVLVFKFEESLTFPNASYISDNIIHYVRAHTKNGREIPLKKGELAWNDEGVKAGTRLDDVILKALVLDFGSVNSLDTTGVQALLDVRRAVDKYADRTIPWHFAGITTHSVRHALLAGGFGVVNESSAVAEVAGVVPDNEGVQADLDVPSHDVKDIETGVDVVHEDKEEAEHEHDDEKAVPKPLSTTNPHYPYFHYDLDDAVAAAIKS